MKEYRKSNQIVQTVLDATQEKGRDGIIITTLMNKSNVPHTRLKKILGKLIGNNLIVEFKTNKKQTFVITEKGIQYLEKYKQFVDVAESFGLEI